MKDLLQTLWRSARATNGPTRTLIAAAVLVALALVGYNSIAARNPSFSLLYSNLDEGQLNAVQTAIAKGGIRFKVSSPPGPYSIWVESTKQYEALSQVATQSALQADPRGISSSSGLDTVWMSAGEREQVMLKRRWQEVELQLETYPWIAQARLTSSTPVHGFLSGSSSQDITVSVVLQLLGSNELSRERRETVSQIVSFAFGVPRERIRISDQNGNRIDTGSEGLGIDEILTHQQDFDRSQSQRVQEALDRAYGPGLTVVSVHGEWNYDELESVDEKIDPTSKVPVSEFSHDTQTPQGSQGSGGGVPGLVTQGNPSQPANGSASDAVATTSESSKEYSFSRNTSLLRQRAPNLRRLSVSVVVDKSLETDLQQIEKAVKGFCGFDEQRDQFTAMTAGFPGVARDEAGKPVLEKEAPVGEPMSPLVGMLIERAVEIVTALAFLFVLLRSLKRSQKPIVQPAEKKLGLADMISDEEVDMDTLARAHVEELLRSDPERVSKLLSRWAMNESFMSRSAP